MPGVLYRKERQVLEFLVQFQSKHGYSPTLVEIAGATGHRSVSTVHVIIRNLVDKGYVQKVDGNARVLKVKDENVISTFMGTEPSIEKTLKNAGKLIRDGKAEAVKIEGGIKRVPVIEALVNAEIPVMGHIGLTPQSIHNMGGYKVQGKQQSGALALIEDAKAIETAGVFAIVLEGIPDVVAKEITKAVKIPTIGIGAGPHCDGQVLVFHDALGLNFGHVPKFVRQYANLGDTAAEALKQFFADIQSGNFPSDAESYHMDKESQKEFKKHFKKVK